MQEPAEINSLSTDGSPRESYTKRNLLRSNKSLIFGDGKTRVTVWRDYFFLKRQLLVERRKTPSDNWEIHYAKSRFGFKSGRVSAEGNGYLVKIKAPLSRRDEVFDEDGFLVGRKARGILHKQEIVRDGRDYVVTSTSRATGEARSEIVSHNDQEAFEKIASGRASISFGRKARSQAGKARSPKSATDAGAHSPADLEAAYDAIHNKDDDQLVGWRDPQTNSEIIQRGVSPEHKVLEPTAEAVPATGEFSRAALGAAYQEIHDAGDELAPSQAHEQIPLTSSRDPWRQVRLDGSGNVLNPVSNAGRPRRSDGLPVPQPGPLPWPVAGPRLDEGLNKPLPALPAVGPNRGGAPTYSSWAKSANVNPGPPMAPYLYGPGASRYTPPSIPPSPQPEFPQSHIASAAALPAQSSSGHLHQLTGRYAKGPEGALVPGPIEGPDPVGLTIVEDARRYSLERPQGGLGLDGGAGALGLLKQQARAQRETGSSSEAGPVPSHRVRGRQGDSNGR